MANNYEMKFKERTPVETVDFIMNIINKFQWTINEEWLPCSDIGTYSLRITLENAPSIGSNGKGTTREYAKASAYAELLERIQNMRVSPFAQLNHIYKRGQSDFIIFENECILSAEELLDENNSFVQMLINRRKVGNASREDRIDSLLAIQKTDFKVLGQYNKFLCIPFYSVRDKKIYHLPYFIYSNLYASNGMCAGNTMSEALIQGISEIMERYINNRELSEMISLPDIPEDFIAKYTEVYKMYTSIKNDDRYIIHMKDASLGGLFPVACLLVTEKNSGKCGVKFGAHPNIGIAMERTFTESVQGESLIQFSRKGEISFFNENVGNASNFINSFRTSDAQYPYQILHNPSQYRYFEFKQNNSLTNDEHLKLELQKILDMGLDVLVNDCSYLGFPSYHIIIPGISEIGIFSDSYLNSTLERLCSHELINMPSKIKLCNTERLLNNMREAFGHVLENSMYYYSGLYSVYNYPGKKENMDIPFFATMCYLQQGDYDSAVEIASIIRNFLKQNNIMIGDELNISLKYVEGISILRNHKEVIKYLRNLFSEELCDLIDIRYSISDKLMEKIYPKITPDSEFCREFINYERLVNDYKKEQKRNAVSYKKLINSLSTVLGHA